MRTGFYKNERKELSERSSLWQPFESHLDSLYFSGAAELLDKQTVAWEFEHFKNNFTRG